MTSLYDADISVKVDDIRIHVPEMEIHQAGAAPDDAGNDVHVSERRIRLAVEVGDLRKREADVPVLKEKTRIWDLRSAAHLFNQFG